MRGNLKWDELLQSSNINIKGQCQSDPKSLISNEPDFWPRWLRHPLHPTVLTILQGVSVQVDHSLGVFCPEAVGPPCRPWAGQHQSSWSSQAWGYNHPTALTDRQVQCSQITTLLHSSSFLLQNWCAKLLEMLNASLDRLYMSGVSLTGICIWILCPFCIDCAALAETVLFSAFLQFISTLYCVNINNIKNSRFHPSLWPLPAAGSDLLSSGSGSNPPNDGWRARSSRCYQDKYLYSFLCRKIALTFLLVLVTHFPCVCPSPESVGSL